MRLAPARPVFHRLRIAELAEAGEDAVALTFEVPDDLATDYAFAPGQHVAIRLPGEEVRRSYSVCGAPGTPLRIGVKRLPGGAFSDVALRDLVVGDELDVLTPTGRFGAALGDLRRPCFVAAGSGITPVLSMLAAALADPGVELVTLLDCNATQRSVMFLEEIAALKDRWPERFHVVHLLTREVQESELLSGRLDPERLARIRAEVVGEVDGWFLCGPQPMVASLRAALEDGGVDPGTVHTELFHADAPPVPPAVPEGAVGAEVEVTLAGLGSTFVLAPGEVVLDGLLRLRADAPYACQGGVCGTCRARLVTGEVTMAATWALEPEELARGDVLTCQARATSDRLVLDFD